MIFVHMQNIDINEILESIDQINNQEKRKLTITMDFLPIIDDDINQITELQASDSTQYAKAWGKLDKQQKINRLMAYVNKLSLAQDKAIQLRKLLIDGVVNKRLTRKTDVEYCQETGEILRIPKLKQQVNGMKNFYLIGATQPLQPLGTEHMMIPMEQEQENLKVTSTSKTSMIPMKKLDLLKITSTNTNTNTNKVAPSILSNPNSNSTSTITAPEKPKVLTATFTNKTKQVTKKQRIKVKPIIHIKYTNGK